MLNFGFHLMVISPCYEYGTNNLRGYNVCPAASSLLAKALASIEKAYEQTQGMVDRIRGKHRYNVSTLLMSWCFSVRYM